MLEGLQRFETECEAATLTYIDGKPVEYGKPWRNHQKLFGHLYLVSCCHWGCHGKEHVFEHLAGRTVTNASVALRSLFHGYYDEALALVRNIGEIANLLNLFWCDGDRTREWLDANEGTRRQTFSPGGIRGMLRDNNALVPFDDDHYGFLCRTAVHPVPHQAPNTYSEHGRPVLGAVFQERGFSLSFWNLLWATAMVCGPLAKIAILDRSRAEELVELTKPVVEASSPNVPGTSDALEGTA